MEFQENTDSTKPKSSQMKTPDQKQPQTHRSPPQYGLKKNTKTAVQEDDIDKVTATLQSYTIDEDEYTLSDDDDDIRMGGMVSTTPSIPIQVHANLEYANHFVGLTRTPRKSHANCDSGADSCVVGKIAKVISTTMKTAHLVGYDPQTT